MTALVVISVYYLGTPIFTSFGVSDRNGFFTALTLGLIFETTIFSLTGTTWYGLTKL